MSVVLYCILVLFSQLGYN